MDLYTLTNTFLADKVVDEFVSAIWTERYFSAGDTQLIVPATAENIAILAPGTYLALRGSKEVMTLETQEIEDRLLTVTGRTLDTFLNTRLCWFRNTAWTSDGENGPLVVDYTDKTKKPGQFISDVVDKMVINTTPFATSWAGANIDWDNDEIPRLSLGAIDASGEVKRLTAVIGPLYDSIQTVAEQEEVGISLYLDSADPITGYFLKFATYKGVDRTSDGVGPLVRLTPDLDSFGDIKEIHSIGIFRNVCYVFYNGTITEHFLDPAGPEPEGLERRVMITVPEDEPVGHTVIYGAGLQGGGGMFSRYVVSAGDISAFREQAAKDALANNNYIHAIDGQASPINDYKFGVDYGLGDIIELEGLTGTISKARVTEYIRSQDKNGEREYPTISVL